MKAARAHEADHSWRNKIFTKYRRVASEIAHTRSGSQTIARPGAASDATVIGS